MHEENSDVTDRIERPNCSGRAHVTLPETLQVMLEADMADSKVRDDHVQSGRAYGPADRIVIREFVQKWLQAANTLESRFVHGYRGPKARLRRPKCQRHR